MVKDSQKRASAAYHAKRKAEGWRKVSLWLRPETVFKIDALKAAAGGSEAVVNDAVLAWKGPGDPEPQNVKPLTKKELAKVAKAGTEFWADKPGDGEQAPKVEVPVMQRKAFNPQPKKGKK